VVLLLGLLAGATLALVALRHRRDVPILMYHRIGNEAADPWTVSPADFAAHMQILKSAGYETILPAELMAYRRFRATLPPRPVILTFDDGYRSILDEVEPVLRKHGFRAIVYLPTAHIADDAAQRASLEGRECLTWPEVRALRERGTIAFGAHSHRHVRLDLEAAPALEVQACVEACVAKGGFHPDSFAYPFGTFSKPVVDALRSAGFTTAVTCSERLARVGWPDKPMKLPRLWVRGQGQPFPLPYRAAAIDTAAPGKAAP
jgi:peptidoglycan/xylan/chitin deacetylase (PgdA/CDA1 family)